MFFRKDIAAMILLSMSAGGLVPVGFMLDTNDETGSVFVRICSVFGPERYVKWTPNADTYSPDQVENPVESDDHDDDTGMATCLASSILSVEAADQFFAPDNRPYARKISLPANRGPPATRTNYAPWPPRGPPGFS